MDDFGFEKEEIILNLAVSYWSKGMKHIMTVYGQVKLTALCILNFFLWLQSEKLGFESSPVSVSSAAENVYHRKLNFNPNIKQKSSYCMALVYKGL